MADQAGAGQLCSFCGEEIRGEVCTWCQTPAAGWDIPVSLDRFIPNYSELSLYAMALTVVLTLVFYGEFRELAARLMDKEGAIILVAYFAVACFALCLCIFHVFSPKRKSDFEKRVMLSFAFLTNFLAGMVAGFYGVDHATGFYAIFPVLTILNCIIFALLMKFEVIDIRSISDENTPLWQVATSTATILLVFFIFKSHLGRQWFITLPACVFYATNINRPVIVALERLGMGRRLGQGPARAGRK
jgi:ACR3 family arsenite efflux pump ArsB